MAFDGSWKMISSDNFDEYMKAVGVGLVTRKMAATATPVQEIHQNGDEFNIKTVTSFKTTDITFKLKVPFDETTADGRTVKTVFTQEGNKLIQDQKGDKDSIITREFNGNEMTMTLVVGDVVCKRIYAKV